MLPESTGNCYGPKKDLIDPYTETPHQKFIRRVDLLQIIALIYISTMVDRIRKNPEVALLSNGETPEFTLDRLSDQLGLVQSNYQLKLFERNPMFAEILSLGQSELVSSM